MRAAVNRPGTQVHRLETARGFAHETPGGGSVEWYTPPWIFDRLDIDFDLDPCCPPRPLLHWNPARERYSPPQDGLALPWSGTVWLNPPYGEETPKWVAKLADHGDGLALVFARTDTRWWQAAIRRAAACCFIAGRVNFCSDPYGQTPAGAAAPSCLLAYGRRCAEAVADADLGVMLSMEAWERRQLEFAA